MKHMKKKNNMKKSAFFTALLLTLSMATAHAQVFLTQEDLNENRDKEWEEVGLVVPVTDRENEESEFVPISSGIAVLTLLGSAYLLGKRKKED